MNFGELRNVANIVDDAYGEMMEGEFTPEEASENGIEVFPGFGTRGTIGIPAGHQDYVVKFENPEGYTSQNVQEQRVWTEANLQRDTKNFMPIQAGRADSGWLVMHRADTLDTGGQSELKHESPWLIRGESPEIGLLNGDPRDIDYGVLDREEWNVEEYSFGSESDMRKAFNGDYRVLDGVKADYDSSRVDDEVEDYNGDVVVLTADFAEDEDSSAFNSKGF